MIWPGIATTEDQEREVRRAICDLPRELAWAALKHIGDLLRPKRVIADTDVRHAIASALLKAKGRAA